MKTRLRILLLLSVIIAVPAIVYPQCDTGSEPECQCETAEILCSINELDGYSFSMSSFQHPEDGPDPLCGGAWVPNNPTWFAFIAWCEELTLTVEISNCSTVGGTTGAQVGVYSDCTNFTEVECIGNDCNNEDDKVLDLTGLVIGNTYYFLIDGCLGSACDVVIDVDGMCTEEIADWTDTEIGPQTDICKDSDITHTVEDLTGAANYHWYIDGTEIDVTDDPELDITWDTEGTFELCVDVSNDCVPEDDDPDEICETITVYDPDAGDITATPNPLCPGETSDIEVTGYNDGAEYTQAIIIVDPSGEVLDVITGANTASVTYDECGDITVYSLNYPNYENITLPTVGGDYSGSDCMALCCDETSLVISFEDDEDPMFSNAPGDLSLACYDEVPAMIDLDATDNCAADAVVAGTENDNSDMCDGGIIERIWMFTDDCGNEVSHSQIITIDPIEAPEYINPPADLDLDCDEMIPDPVDLTYDNGGIGSCLINGIVTATVTGSFDLCGSTIEYEWDFTDMCGNNLNHVQTIEIEAADLPDFVNTPSDMTIDCEDDVPTADDLDYTNGETAPCIIEGTVSPTIDGSFDPCGTTITYSWEYTDPCGNTIEHEQVIEVIASEKAEFIDPPADITLSCEEYDDYVFEDLDYTNNSADPCDISGAVSPVIDDNSDECGGTVEALYEYTDDCGRTIEHTQTIIVDPAPQADFTNFPADITVQCSDIPDPADDLSYTNGEDGTCLIEGAAVVSIDEDVDECGGTITNTWEFTDDCGRTIEHVQTITVEEAPQAEFDMFPSDMTMDCDEFAEFDPETLDYSNSESGLCLIEGLLDPETDGDINECGGTIFYIWEFTDNCGRTIEHTQQLNVNPAPVAEFQNVPSDITVDCSEVNEDPEFLQYDNGEDGMCEIKGWVEAIASGNVNECGGTQTMTWTFTDNCNRVITETQQITYLPAEDPEFEDFPEDMLLDCDEDVPDPEDLEYTNDLEGPCEISGEVEATVEVDENIYIYTWTYTNACTGNTIEYVQEITKLIPVEFEEDEFEFELCQGLELDLSDIELIDINNTLPDFTYHDDLPPDSSNEIDEEVLLEEDYAEFYIVGTNNMGCFDIATVYIFAEEAVSAGEDTEIEFCIGDELLDLYEYLEFPASLDGEFEQTDGPVDLDFVYADEINVADAEPGFYTFLYYVESDNSCPDDESTMIMELYPEVSVELLALECSADGQTYTAIFAHEDYNFNISAGVIDSETETEITIINIPIDHNISIEVSDPETICEEEYQFTAPDCDCPMVSTPVSNGNSAICAGEAIPQLSVSVGQDEIAHWYDAPVGGNLLQSNSLTYQPIVNTPGIYSYYVEAESTIQTGCYSSVRTEISLTVSPLPEVIDTFYNVCNYDHSGFETFGLDELIQTLNFEIPNLDFEFYKSLSDLDDRINAVEFPFTNDSLGHQLLYILVTNGANCSSVSSIDLRINDIPELQLDATDESCADALDGIIESSISPESLNSFLIFNMDSIDPGTMDNLAPGLYSFVAVDSLNCRDTADVNIEAGIELVFSDISFECFDNGTSSDPSDDYYLIDLVVNSVPSSGDDYILRDGSGQIDQINSFGETVQIQLDADATDLDLSALNISENCVSDTTVTQLLPCSSDCLLELVNFDFACNDNGTIYDPSDDYYDVSINMTAINGSSSYNVYVNDILNYSFDYGEDNSFTLIADGQSYSIHVADNQFVFCQYDLGEVLSTTCSDQCLIETSITNILCDNNGTLETELDDSFSFELLVTSLNASDSFEIVDPPMTAAYGEAVDLSGYLISLDSVQIIIYDQEENSCIDSLTVYAPAPCSEPCTTEILDFALSACDNNGTPNDTLDDFYSVSFNVNVLDGNTGMVLIDDNMGNSYGPFNYNEPINLGPFAATGDTIELSIFDDTNPVCLIIQEFSMASCSEPCIVDVEIIAINCNDNNTLDSNADDLYSFEVYISGINVSSNGFVSNLMIDGPYDENYIFGDFLISDGDVELTVSDAEFPDCETTITIEAPTPCSQPCTLEVLNYEILECDDNATPTDVVDDNYSVSFNISATDGEVDMYIVTDSDGNTYGPFEYDMDIEIGPFTADGSVIEFVFSDPSNTTCILELSASQESCSDLCVLNTSVSNIICSDSNTPESNLDDVFNFELLVDGVNNSTQYTILELGITGTYGTPLLVDNQLISNGDLSISIVDQDDPGCIELVEISAPEACSSPCDLELLQFEILDCDNNGTGADSSDDFYSIQFIVSLLDGEAQEFIITDNNSTEYGPFQYGELIELGPFTSDGSITIFSLSDLNNAVCDLEFESSQNECSDCPQTIEIIADNYTINCQDQFSNLSVQSDGIITDYSWTSGQNFSSGQANLQVNNGGTYELTVIFDNGCALSSSVEIEENMDTPEASIQFEGILNCETTSIPLDGSNSIGISNALFEWFDSDQNLISNEDQISVSEPGNYSLIITDTVSNCVSELAEVNVTENLTTPEANGIVSGELNCEISSVLIDASSSVFNTNTIFSWTDENGNLVSNDISFDTEEAGDYTLVLTDTISQCVSNTFVASVISNDNTPEAVILANPGNIFDCVIETIELSTLAEDNTTYSWIINNEQISTELSIEVENPSQVTLIALDTISLCQDEEILQLEDFTEFPLLELSDIEVINCEFEEICVELTTASFGQDLSIFWYDQTGSLVAEDTELFCTNQVGNYTVEVVDQENNCENSETIMVEGPSFIDAQIQAEIVLTINDNYTLEPLITSGASNIAEFYWISDAELSCYDCLNPQILSFNDGDEISLVLISDTDCETIVSTRIREEIIEIPRVYIPNVFTGDRSENFTIFASEEVDLIENMYIFDRWGELIYSNSNFPPNDPAQGWDGTFNDKKVEQGVYVYLFIYQLNGKTEKTYGDVTLLW